MFFPWEDLPMSQLMMCVQICGIIRCAFTLLLILDSTTGHGNDDRYDYSLMKRYINVLYAYAFYTFLELIPYVVILGLNINNKFGRSDYKNSEIYNIVVITLYFSIVYYSWYVLYLVIMLMFGIYKCVRT